MKETIINHSEDKFGGDVANRQDLCENVREKVLREFDSKLATKKYI